MARPAITCQRDVVPGVDRLGHTSFIPEVGYLGITSHLVRAPKPLLIDLGLVSLGPSMLEAIEAVIDPASIRFLYLTHMDGDHLGCLDQLLVRAPEARVVTTYLGMTKLVVSRRIDPTRFYLLNPGQELDLGDRKLRVVKPPCFDAPETTMLWDASRSTLFSSDYFGSLLPSPAATANEVAPESLRDAITKFLSIDVPWIHGVRPEVLEDGVRAVASLRPEMVLGAHLPPAHNLIDALSDAVLAAPNAPKHVDPDQQAFEQMLRAAR